MTLTEYADLILYEWARWQQEDMIRCGWPKSTSFGRAIKPDPVPAREPIDDARAYQTDIMLAHLPKRMRFVIRLHYLDRCPIDTKARRLRIGREGYKALISGIHKAVAIRIATDAAKAYKRVDCLGVPEQGSR